MVFTLSAGPFLFCSSVILAQPTDLQFTRLTTRDGLSNNRVHKICQDGRGFMWFGTPDGLNRYDGHTLKVYRGIEGDSTSLYSNWVQHMHVDGRGDLWIAATALHKYDLQNDRFIRYRPEPGNAKRWVTGLHSESDGRLWVGGDGLDKFDPATGIFKRIEIGPHGVIWSLASDSIGNLWIGTHVGEVIRLDKKTLQYERLPDPGRLGEVRELYVDRSILWIAAATGLFKLEHRGK